MNSRLRHKDLIDETIIKFKEKYPTMDTFLNLDYNTRFDLIHTIVEIHEESIKEATERGVEIQLPFIGRLKIKDGKVLYNKIIEEYLLDNNIKDKKDLTEEDKLEIANLMKMNKLKQNLDNKKTGVEKKVFTFNKKV